MRATDAGLHCKILAELQSEVSLRQQGIGVVVQGGVVTLSGCVDSHDHKQEVQRTAARVSGVEAVSNELEVRTPGPRERTYPEIAHAVANHLHNYLRIPLDVVRAKVEHGWVTLEGEVELFRQRNLAEGGVSNLAGVRGVTNLIIVRPPEAVKDIKSKVDAVLVGTKDVGEGPRR